MKATLIAALLVLSCAAASAQNKRDIRGLYPGMSAAEALTHLRGMPCQLFDANEYALAPACIYQRRDYLRNEGLYAFFAGSLPDRPVWAIVLTFGSILNREQISEALSQQFQVKFGPNDIAKPGDNRTRVDLGNGLMLCLAPEQGNFVQGYRLSVWSELLWSQEERAVLQNAAPRF
jgi:hypothetical protein